MQSFLPMNSRAYCPHWTDKCCPPVAYKNSLTIRGRRSIISLVSEIKAEKRRVEEERNHRESRQVERDMGGFFEHGLGAAHRPYGFLRAINRLRQAHLL